MDAEEYDITLHPHWTVRLSPEGLYELRYKGAVQLRNTEPAPPMWSSMVRMTRAVLVVLQRSAGRDVVEAELLAALQAGQTLAVGARLAHCANPGHH
ncbi:hypothetical protein [Streptomyces malaysiensis]|uniref:DNA-directed RNA polymerase beta' subunit n=1 Tax=Streptomyces malaysiensis TaxID=92644 RepID=A0A7X6AZ56_STRMQ|nr:hypothetical protein [Streptomyces malaysiensis]NIY68079.1 DNA-directed RNA polymerase beta' subunit [Streptomyces malaysiensis]